MHIFLKMSVDAVLFQIPIHISDKASNINKNSPVKFNNI